MGSEMCIRDSGQLIENLENVEDSASQMADFALSGQTVAQQITMLAGLTAEDADAALQHILRPERMAVMYIEPDGTAVEEDEEEETAEEVAEELQQFEAVFEQLRISTLLIGPYDRDNAIVTLHAGAGGTEAMDWTGMLYRMYSRWAEKKGYELEVLDYLEGDVAGIKGVTFEVKGENAYGYLRSEKGVHRLVRISPFNAAGKRQTSFASCDVIPDIEEDIDIEINEDELRIDTYRSSGAGGQHLSLIHISEPTRP